jgi:hypothetical protein
MAAPKQSKSADYSVLVKHALPYLLKDVLVDDAGDGREEQNALDKFIQLCQVFKLVIHT